MGLGEAIMKNFVLEIAQCTPNYTLSSRMENSKQYIRDTVGNNKVLVC
jgi:hypothetical protein